MTSCPEEHLEDFEKTILLRFDYGVEKLRLDHGVEKLRLDHVLENLGSDHGIEKLRLNHAGRTTELLPFGQRIEFSA